MRFTLIVILVALFFKSHTNTIRQIKLPTGLYKLCDSGKYKLTLDGKIYYTDAEPIATLKNMKNFNITQDRGRKGSYILNFELDDEGVKKLGYAAPFSYGKSTQIALIIQGELKAAPFWSVPIASKTMSISDTSKSKLNQIADKLRAEKEDKL